MRSKRTKKTKEEADILAPIKRARTGLTLAEISKLALEDVNVKLFFRRPSHTEWHSFTDSGVFAAWRPTYNDWFDNKYLKAESIAANDWILQPKGWSPFVDNSESQTIKDMLKLK
jgi:hypothetical protein